MSTPNTNCTLSFVCYIKFTCLCKVFIIFGPFGFPFLWHSLVWGKQKKCQKKKLEGKVKKKKKKKKKKDSLENDNCKMITPNCVTDSLVIHHTNFWRCLGVQYNEIIPKL